jgi:hypothetical protein
LMQTETEMIQKGFIYATYATTLWFGHVQDFFGYRGLVFLYAP